jgi:uncharacterized protein
MNVDEIWREFASADEMPVEAIQSALDHWDEVSARFLAKLRAQAAGAHLPDADRDALFVAVHLFAEKRDQRAYAPLCAELARNADVGTWLGDALDAHLPGMLINLYDGDPAPLYQVAESPEADGMARGAAIQTLGYLTRASKAIDDDTMRAYMRTFGQNLTDGDDPTLGVAWATTVAALGYDDLGPDVARAISRGAVFAEAFNIKDFHEDLREARSDETGLAVFLREGVKPFETTVEALTVLSEMYDEDEEFEDGENFEGEPASSPEEPHVNPFRDVGRNDPCPCGSGKKFKKCCLAA